LIKGGRKMTKWLCISILVLVTLGIWGSSSFAKVELSDVAGMWFFDEGGGKEARDSSENGNKGEIVGAKWIEGEFEKALSFDGNDDYVDVMHSVSLEPVSVSGQAWVKLKADGTRHIIFAKWTGYTLEVSTAGNPYFQIRNAQGQLGSTSPTPNCVGELASFSGYL